MHEAQPPLALEEPMTHVCLRDFREQIDRYLEASRTLAIDKDDRTVGYFVPVPTAADEQFRQAMARIEDTLQRVLSRTGLTEDALADLLDPQRPPSRESAGDPRHRASGR
jgi:hypothetical protein